MRKLTITVLVLALLGVGYLYLRNYRMPIRGLEGEIETVGRGDLTIPINALGEVRPKSRREIKAEASGEVEKVLVEAGDIVRAGDVLIRIKRDDEERSVKRAQQELMRTQINLERAEVVATQRRTCGIPAAQAQLAQWEARLARAEFEKNRIEELARDGSEPPVAFVRAQASHQESLAQVNAARADLDQAKIAVELAEKDVALAKAAVETAKTTLADAQKRLAKTTIVAPVDGMVAQVFVKEGEVIQGGKTTITGGTVLAVLADWSERYVRAEVDEADIGVVLAWAPPAARPGGNVADPADPEEENREPPITAASTVKINVEAYPDEDFEGVIERVYPEPRKQVSVVTFLVDIRVSSVNRDKLMSAMQADVEFTAQSVYDAVLVPHEAIRRGPDGRLGVYIPKKVEGQKEPEPQFVPCRIGLDNGIYAQVIEGLKEGDKVFTKLPQKTDREREAEEEG